MLRKNPLQPPRPFTAARSAVAAGVAQPGHPAGFMAADDFDATGIMTGVDPSESRYWWVPELYGPEAGPGAGPESADLRVAEADIQATSRAGSRAAAAA